MSGLKRNGLLFLWVLVVAGLVAGTAAAPILIWGEHWTTIAWLWCVLIFFMAGLFWNTE